MKLQHTILLAVISIALIWTACKKQDTSDQTYTVTSSGTTIKDNATGVTIVVPPNATSQSLNFTISKSSQTRSNLTLIGGNSFSVASEVFKIETNLINNLDSCATVTLPYDPSKVSDPSALAVAYYSDIAQKWIPAEISNIDLTNHKVSFYTAHFSKWSLYNFFQKVNQTSSFASSINTGFIPNIDGFPFINNFPAPYDYTTTIFNLKHGEGNCVGFSILSIFFYNHLKNITNQGLYDYSYRGPDPNYSQPNSNVIYYNSIYQGINKVASDAQGFFVKLWNAFGDYFSFHSIKDNTMAVRIYNTLNSTRTPILLAIKDNNGNYGHVVVIYKYSKNSNGGGTFFYYDPNIPGVENFFTHNVDGTINTFQYGDVQNLFAGQLSVSSSLAGALSDKELKNIFDTYFIPNSSNNYKLAFSDDFNNVTTTENNFIFTNPNWGTTQHTVAHTVTNSYLELRMDQTDANSNALVNYDFSSANRIKIVCDLFYHEGTRQYYEGNYDFYFPQISFFEYSPTSQKIVGDNIQFEMQTNYYSPDNPCGDPILPTFRFFSEPSTSAICPQNLKRMNSFLTATSASFYDRWLKGVTIIFDKSTGYINVDIDGDQAIDLAGIIPTTSTSKINTISFSPYGWWTGHLMRIRNLKIYKQ